MKAIIASNHQDYALTHRSPDNNLYAWFKVPNLPTLWAAFASGALDEPALFDAIARERFAEGAPVRSGAA